MMSKQAIRTIHRFAMTGTALGALLAVGCGDSTHPKGELMLAISTDMSIDNDLDRVDVIVERENGDLFNETVDLYPKVGGLFTPGTYAIVAGDQEGESVRVSLVARKDNKARVVRELRTTIPHERVGLVPMPVQWLCESELSTDLKSSSCFAESPGGKKTCNVGRCADNTVSEDAVEAYSAKEVYGGYESSLDAARHGACFDVLRCFDGSKRVELDLDTCTFTRPAGMKTPNVGLVVKEDGHCNPVSGQCYIPLDASKAFGWVANGDSIEVPGGVCDRLRDGRVLAVVTTGACDTKKITTPACGPWLGPTGSNDRDGDGVADAQDNCADMPNPTQADADADAIGDACDLAASEPDQDGDSVADAQDNCPTFANTDQVDTDKDGLGDSCDTDDDDDGYVDSDDPAPLNPFEPDQDQDKVRTGLDNCPSIANPDQLDTDKDGQGDACDSDLDGDGVVNKLDNCAKVSNPTQDDCDGNGVGTACDQCSSRITVTKPLSNSALPSRVFQVAGSVGTLNLSALSIQTQSVATGRQFSQTVPVSSGAFSSGNLILSAGQNQVTANSCNCQSEPILVTANVSPADILVTLTWDKPLSDLDLYVYEPGSSSTACYFDATCAIPGGTTPLGAVLDTDNTLGYGPENYSLSTAAGNTLAPGSYRVRVHYFDGSTPVTFDARVLLNENASEEQVAHFTGQLTQSSRTNTLPGEGGLGWADVAEILCEGTPTRCTVRAMTTTGETSGTAGAAGAAGVDATTARGGAPESSGTSSVAATAVASGGRSAVTTAVVSGGNSAVTTVIASGGSSSVATTLIATGGSSSVATTLVATGGLTTVVATGGTFGSGGVLATGGTTAALATGGTPVVADADADGVDDTSDNCEFVANRDQADRDENGIGDVCECTTGSFYVRTTGKCVASPCFADVSILPEKSIVYGAKSLTSFDVAKEILTVELDASVPQPTVSDAALDLWDYAVQGPSPAVTLQLQPSSIYRNRLLFDLRNYVVSRRGISHAALRLFSCDGFEYPAARIDMTLHEPTANAAKGQVEIIRAPICYDQTIGSALGTKVWQGATVGQGFDHYVSAWATTNFRSPCAGFGEDVALLWTAPADGTYQFTDALVKGATITLLDPSCANVYACANVDYTVSRAMKTNEQVVIVIGSSNPGTPVDAQLSISFVQQ